MHTYSFTRIGAQSHGPFGANDKPMVTINTYGALTLNNSAMRLLDFASGSVDVLVDIKGGVLALRPVEAKKSGSYKLAVKANHKYGVVSCSRSFEQFGIDVPRWHVLRFTGDDIETLEREKLLVLHVKSVQPEPIRAVSNNAWGRKLPSTIQNVTAPPPVRPLEIPVQRPSTPPPPQAPTDVPNGSRNESNESYEIAQLRLFGQYQIALKNNLNAAVPEALDRDVARIAKLLATAEAIPVHGPELAERVQTLQQAQEDRLSALVGAAG